MPAIFLSLLLAAQARPVPPSYSPGERQTGTTEPLCIPIMLVSRPRLDDAIAACRERYGWSESEERHGLRAADYNSRMLEAWDRLRGARIDMEPVFRLFQGLSLADREELGKDEEGAEGQRLRRLVMDRIAAAGLARPETVFAFILNAAAFNRESRLLLYGE